MPPMEKAPKHSTMAKSLCLLARREGFEPSTLRSEERWSPLARPFSVAGKWQWNGRQFGRSQVRVRTTVPNVRPSSGALEHQPNQACAPHLLPAKGHRDHMARPGTVVSLLGEHRVELGVQVVVGFTGLQPQRHPVPGSVLLQAARRGEQLPVVLSRPTAGSEAKLVRACGKSDLLVDDAPSEAVERLGAVDVDPVGRQN